MNLLFDTGPKGALWLMQAAQPHMAANNWGRIVTMGTSMGLTGASGYGPYAASNEAIRSITRTAANEWGRDGITVKVCIYRLETDTEWSLEVVNAAGTSIVWDELFSSDNAAKEEFLRTVAEDGMATFLDSATIIPFRR